MKTLAIAALAFASVSATQSGIPARMHPEVVRVDCMVGSGSAFRVSPHVLLSVNHVTSLDGCFIGDKPFTVLSHVGDFSIIKSEEIADSWLKIDCGGFIKGRRYVAVGYARGLDTQTTVDLTATGNSDGQFSILSGVWTVIPGQSGGAVIDPATGAVVGTVNVYNMESGASGSVALKGTSVCPHS